MSQNTPGSQRMLLEVIPKVATIAFAIIVVASVLAVMLLRPPARSGNVVRDPQRDSSSAEETRFQAMKPDSPMKVVEFAYGTEPLCPACKSAVGLGATRCASCRQELERVTRTCTRCKGTVKVTCPKCYGTKQYKSPCPNCAGSGGLRWVNGQFRRDIWGKVTASGAHKGRHLNTGKDFVGNEVVNYSCPDCEGKKKVDNMNLMFPCTECNNGKVPCRQCGGDGLEGD